MPKNGIKIVHTTYEEARGRSPKRSDSDLSIKVGRYASRKLSNNGEEQVPFSGIRSSPREETSRAKGFWATGTTFRLEKDKIQKPVGNLSAGTISPLKERNGHPSPPSMLASQRKGRFSLKRKSNKTRNLELMEPLDLRRAMNEGKLERTIPPQDISKFHITQRLLSPLAPPPRLTFLESCPSPQAPNKSSGPNTLSTSRKQSFSTHRQTRDTNSISNRLAEYLGASADILDETRRELQEKFLPPFDNLNYHSFSLTRRTSVSSVSSEESFWCIGEQDKSEENARAAQELKIKQEVNGTRLSGGGTYPRRQASAKRCRLCAKHVAGSRGLCRLCVADSLGRKENSVIPSSHVDINEDIKPTPPLKDRKNVLKATEQLVQKSRVLIESITANESPQKAGPRNVGKRQVQLSDYFESCGFNRSGETEDSAPGPANRE